MSFPGGSGDAKVRPEARIQGVGPQTSVMVPQRENPTSTGRG